MEIWKDIEGYEGLYKVSNLGNVISLKYRRGLYERNLSLNNHYGYKKVVLCKNNVNSNLRVHRLVAICFIPNPENKPCINHKNGIKDDNCVENLEWCTQKENILHKYKILGHKSGYFGKRGVLNNCSKNISQIDISGNIVRTWDSAMDIKRELGYNNSMICAVCRGKYKTAYGYKWEYLNNQ